MVFLALSGRNQDKNFGLGYISNTNTGTHARNDTFDAVRLRSHIFCNVALRRRVTEGSILEERTSLAKYHYIKNIGEEF